MYNRDMAPDFRYQGFMDYGESLASQREYVLLRSEENIPDTVLFVEHPPVYTVGRNETESRTIIEDIPVHKVDRGGKMTFHGPGQLVIYPLVDLMLFDRDIRKYVGFLTDTVIHLLRGYGLSAAELPGLPGVWIGARKICAVGIRINKINKRWIASHGLALNVSVDQRYYAAISPCGLSSASVTTMEAELGRVVDLTEVTGLYQEMFRKHYAILGKGVGKSDGSFASNKKAGRSVSSANAADSLV
ncbi:lipoyl(octanoyl) transferase LipB [Paenibacillus sp. GCM10027626]|uniref:lipoyl(octanoyl) transferase LipB n=1 Tax=Paenibacillus sp. GCM10027626 TaxID=3273411 RepID=UPI00363440BB